MTQHESALLRLLEQHSYKRIAEIDEPDLGLAEHRPFPFMAIVGQLEMRTALLLAVINPAIGGVLLIGPRGIAKTTAVRSITGILPYIEVSDCEDEVLPEDLEALEPQVAEALYPDCYEKYKQGESISHFDSVKLVELPLNARLEDVVGGINERAAIHHNAVRIERGILSRADNNILYVDEINLLDDEIVDAILDAAAQGSYTVRRGANVGTYRARFVLVGSMNPEEGRLRPQIMDRLGLRINVRGLSDIEERIEVYKRVRDFRRNPTAFIRHWEMETAQAREEILLARENLKRAEIPDDTVRAGIELVNQLDIDSHRAEFTMFEAARAHAAADDRTEVIIEDLKVVAPLALRQRRSEFMVNFFHRQNDEDDQISHTLDAIIEKQKKTI